MGDQAARADAEAFRKGGGGNPGGRGRHNQLGARNAVDLLVDLALHVGAFEHVLLCVGRALQRIGKAGGDGNTRPRGCRIVDQPVAFECREIGLDTRDRSLALAFRPVVERDPVASTGEDDRPGAADQAGADDGNLVGHKDLLRPLRRRCC